MPKVTMQEVYSVSVQIDDDTGQRRRVRPRSVWFDELSEAVEAIQRAISTLPAEITIVTLIRERVDEFDNTESDDLNDWPAERHIVTGKMAAEDYD